MTELELTCLSCASSFDIIYEEDETSDEVPNFCPFCGERIEVTDDEYIDEESIFEEDDE